MKKLFIKIIMVVVGALPAIAPLPALAVDFPRADLDRMSNSLNHGNLGVFGLFELGTQMLADQQRAVRCTYDFANQGGAIGALNLASATTDALNKPKTSCMIPKGAIVMEVLVDTVTALTSGGSATLALSTGQSANDILGATGYASYTGILAGTPVGTAATAIKMTADRTPTVTIATAAVTAGKFYVIINYNVSQTL